MSKFKEIKNPQWANVEKTMIDIQVKLNDSNDFIPYTVMRCDEQDITEIFNNISLGKHGSISDVDTDRYKTKVRNIRDRLLEQCDWTQSSDVPEETKNKWSKYRQALRDITKQSGFPFNVIYPEKP